MTKFSNLAAWYHLKQRMVHTNLPDWAIDLYQYIEHYKEEIDTEISQASCLNDPMNGCPGDFAEDFSKRNRISEYEWETNNKLELSDKAKEWADKVIGKYQDKEWANYEENTPQENPLYGMNRWEKLKYNISYWWHTHITDPDFDKLPFQNINN